MSAIAGMARFDDAPGCEEACARMLRALDAFGPHGSGQWNGTMVSLGHRLYRTLPEDRFDRQPLHSDRFVLAADVRIDNRDELAAALGLRGDDCRTMADSAFLLAATARWGENAPDHVLGDYAYACWDKLERRLTLARDFMGQRPLYFHAGKGFVAFASMAKGLHALPEIPFVADEETIANHVMLLPHSGPRTFFAGVERVEPGGIVTVSQDGLKRHRYWQPQRPRRGKRWNPDDCAEGLRHHLDEATRCRLRGAGNAVASQLSAGLDSSAVTATVARLLTPENGRVVAFTAVPRKGYGERGKGKRLLDEGRLAAATAALYPNIEHILVRAGSASPVEENDRIFYFLEQPIANPFNWTWHSAICRQAQARGLGVLFTGQAGNMSLSYGGQHLLAELLRQGRLVKLAREASALAANGMPWSAILVRATAPFGLGRFWLWARETLRQHPRPSIREITAVNPQQYENPAVAGAVFALEAQLSGLPAGDGFAARLDGLRMIDPGSYTKGTLAGWGVELRDPTADRRLVEYCLSLPTELYLSHGVSRALAKRALRDRLPADVVRQDYVGYQAADWFEGLAAARSAVAEEVARLENCPSAERVLDLKRLQGLIESWPESGWQDQIIERDYRLALLRGIAAGHFLRRTSGTNS